VLVATQDPDTADEEALHHEYHYRIRDGLGQEESAAMGANRVGATDLGMETPWDDIQ